MNNLADITIHTQLPLFGNKGDTLATRLRRVTLRGFPNVRIYKKASFAIQDISPEEIPMRLYTSQPHVHQQYLDRLNKLAELFARQGINIFHLQHAYDYTATDDQGQETEWTIIPPIVERHVIPRAKDGSLHYAPLIAQELQQLLTQNGWCINPRIASLRHVGSGTTFCIINDGAHRVHAGLQNGGGIRVIEVSGVTPGYPYYAAPQDYSAVQVFGDVETAPDLKVNTLAPPAHKLLYRQFPEAGIMTGTIRPPRAGEVWV